MAKNSLSALAHGELVSPAIEEMLEAGGVSRLPIGERPKEIIVCAHAYLPKRFGMSRVGGPSLGSWAKARKLPYQPVFDQGSAPLSC